MTPDITSPSNERIKWLVRLRERRHRDAEGVFLIEGERLYRRALDAGLFPRLTFVSAESETGAVGETLTVAPQALDRASYRQRSQDLIGVFPQIDTTLGAIATSTNPLVLITEDVEKPGNLGAMLRTAGAAGVDALIVIGEKLDVHNPNVVRASTGALFSVPVAVAGWHEVESWLGERGIELAAASPDATSSLWESELTGPIALVVGAEDEGLSDRAVDAATRLLGIPQVTSSVDSLNVSVAAAILLFEARRQRTADKGT